VEIEISCVFETALCPQASGTCRACHPKIKVEAMKSHSSKLKFFRHFSLIAGSWFPGSAWEPHELQALPGLCDKEQF
jgi:hypothetical protein